MLFQVGLSGDQHVCGEPIALEMLIYPHSRLAAMCSVRDDHQDIKIAIRFHASCGGGAKQEDPSGCDGVYDAADQCAQ